MIRQWNDLPDFMKNDFVYEYYKILKKKRTHIVAKKIFDKVLAAILLIILVPLLIIIGLFILIDSKGPIVFHQVRVTQYGKKFKIFKFRTMVINAEKIGAQVTTKNDARVTRAGKFLRKFKFDEILQLFNILLGDMSFVGTRPEVPKYIEKYTEEMLATLLLPAGITSEASIRYKDEELLLANADDVDETYINEVLPEKMKYNLKSIKEFSFFKDIMTMVQTVLVVGKKNRNIEHSAGSASTDKSEVNV